MQSKRLFNSKRKPIAVPLSSGNSVLVPAKGFATIEGTDAASPAVSDYLRRGVLKEVPSL